MKYATIVADPPWPYQGSGFGSSAQRRPNSYDSPRNVPGSQARYGSMSISDMCSLEPPTCEQAHLYLWTTNAFMVEAHGLARAWGFEPKTICTWGKITSEGHPSYRTGYYFRGATEHWVFAVRGSLRIRITNAPTLWLWPRFPHSVKPDAFYDLVEEASPGPYLEMFARRQRLGWDTWGNEALEHVELVV